MRALLLSVLVVFAASPAVSQALYGFGARVGGNQAELGLGFPDFGSRTGILGSVFAEFNIMQDVTAITELEFAQRGYMYHAWHEETDEERTAVSALDYVSLPLLLRVRVTAAENVDFYLSVGPRVEMIVGQTVGVVTFDDGTSARDPLGDAITTTLFGGITVGGGLALREILPREVRLDFRYNYGLGDLAPEEPIFVRQSALDLALVVVF